MYSKGKTVPSEEEAREKLVLYVYEYLVHAGAQKAAMMFLSEIKWEKNITIGEPSGFLHSWWCVFWDLFCAAPERRNTHEHSSEAKAFHDYGFVRSGFPVNASPHNVCGGPNPLDQVPSIEGFPGGPVPPNYNPGMRPQAMLQSSRPQPPFSHNQMCSSQPCMGLRYPGPGGPRPGMRMPQMGPVSDFGGHPNQPTLSSPMDSGRQGDNGDFMNWQGLPGPGMMNPRMNPPKGSPVNSNSYGPPISTVGPGGIMGPGVSGAPNAPGRRSNWQMTTSAPMNYSSSLPVSYNSPIGSTGSPTSVMSNPQECSDSSAKNMFMMKSVSSNDMSGDFPMGGGTDNGSVGLSSSSAMGPVGMTGDELDGIKHSPASGGPGTPRDDGGNGIGDYSLGNFGGSADNVGIGPGSYFGER